MAYSSIKYTGDGVTTDFAVTFDYLDRDHVKVRVNKVFTEAVGSLYKTAFVNSTTLRVDTVSGSDPVPSGVEVELIRQTPIDVPAVVFGGGASLSSENLNKNSEYLTFALQEATDTNEEFTKVYLGSFTSFPTTDNEGNPLRVGAVVFYTPENALYYYTAAGTWVVGESVSLSQAAASAAASSASNASLSATNAQAASEQAEAAAVSTGRPYATRSLFIAANIPASVTKTTFFVGGNTYDVVRDAAGPIIQTNGERWRPDGDVTPLHFGDYSASNNSPAIQAAVDYVLDPTRAVGGEVFIPAGSWPCASEIVVSLNGISGLPNSNLRRISIRGEGMGATVLKAQIDGMRLMDIEGSSPLTSGSYGYMDIVSDISFAGNSPTSRTTTGLRVKNIAFARMKNVGFFNFNVGMVSEGALSSVFENVNFRENTTGLSSAASSSHPNANTFVGCNWQFCTNLAIDGYTGTSNATFIGCNIEQCGTQATPGTGGVHLRCSGSQGEVALTFIGGYVENNRGDFDFLIEETSTNKVLVSFSGTNFQRTSDTNFVTNNIVTTGQVIVRTDGCAFTRAGTYVADAGRPYINITALGQHISIGDRFEDAVEAPRTDQGAVYAGFVQGSLGASVTGSLPRGWSVSQLATGFFRVTHNFGDTGYAPTACIVSANARFVERIVRNAGSFDVRVLRTADNVATDDDFSFVVQKFGGPS